MTYFAHLNDYILLANFKCKICSVHGTLEVLTDHSRQCRSKVRFIGGGGGGGRSRVPNAGAARGVQRHAPPSDFEL